MAALMNTARPRSAWSLPPGFQRLTPVSPNKVALLGYEWVRPPQDAAAPAALPAARPAPRATAAARGSGARCILTMRSPPGCCSPLRVRDAPLTRRHVAWVVPRADVRHLGVHVREQPALRAVGSLARGLRRLQRHNAVHHRPGRPARTGLRLPGLRPVPVRARVHATRLPQLLLTWRRARPRPRDAGSSAPWASCGGSAPPSSWRSPS